MLVILNKTMSSNRKKKQNHISCKFVNTILLLFIRVTPGYYWCLTTPGNHLYHTAWSCMLMQQPPYCFHRQYLCSGWPATYHPKTMCSCEVLHDFYITGSLLTLAAYFHKLGGINYLGELLLSDLLTTVKSFKNFWG